MRTLWGLVLGDRLKRFGSDLDLHRWRGRFARDGLTTTLRLELSDLLSPRVSLRAPFEWPVDEDEGEEETGSMRQLVEWEIVLSAKHVHGDIRELAGNESWVSALPALLTGFTELLRDALDLMRELGDADDRSDWSYVSQPSIGEHAQNSSMRDWTALIELNRDAWRAVAAASPDRALAAAQAWSSAALPPVPPSGVLRRCAARRRSSRSGARVAAGRRPLVALVGGDTERNHAAAGRPGAATRLRRADKA